MTIFFRLLETDDKGTALHQAIQQLAQKQPNPNTFAVEPASFQRVPGAPFAYWVSDSIRQLFTKTTEARPSYETRCGMGTLDDFRFLRLAWEINQEHLSSTWIPYAKGGELSLFYSKIYIFLNWRNSGNELKTFVTWKVGSASRKIQSESFYFRSGLTWSRRTTSRISLRVLPKGCIFSDQGSALFVKVDDEEKLLSLLAITNSRIFLSLVELSLGAADAAARTYEVGLVQRTPVPDLTPESTTTLATLARRAWSFKRSLDTVTQTSHAFVLPALLQVNSSSLSDCSLSSLAKAWTDNVTAVESELAHIQTQIDDLVFDLYGISEESGQWTVGSEESDQWTVDSDQQELPTPDPRPLTTSATPDPRPLITDEEEESEAIAADLPSLTSELLAYLLSVAFGRFDVRLATGDRSHPSEPEPFDPLPVCSPGMLMGDNGFPAIAPTELPPDYPIQIPFDGILVDDEGHSRDIVNRVRAVLDVVFSDQWTVNSEQPEKLTTDHQPLTTYSASDIEQEICQILRVSSLRDYFRKPTAFFNDHLSRYSKSRRQAPIYLPLSTRSGNYTLWLYYHRLTDQTLYTCINDYVEPKLARVKEQIEGIRRAVGSGQWAVGSDQKKTPTTDHRSPTTEIERLQDLESELEDFRDELQRIAQFWKPNLNDGVQINLSPLWSLFRLGKWQKKLKETWDKLEKGDYDWAHLAHSIWAKRVEEKCKKDKSLAIAHNLEHLYETPPETPKSTKRKKKE